MRKRARLRHDAHTDVRAVVNEHHDFFAATDGGATQVGALDTSVPAVDGLFTELTQRRLERKLAVQSCREKRSLLRDALRLVVAVSRKLTLDVSIASVLVNPPEESDDQLLADARAIHDAASAHADAFVAAGLPPTLLATLAADVQALAAARDMKSLSTQRFTAATEAITAAQNATDKTIAVLDGIALVGRKDNPGILTKLRQARRVGPRKAAADQAATAAPPAAPAAAPAPSAPAETPKVA
jgi:hypothetical protein